MHDHWCWIGSAGSSAGTDGELRFAALYLWVAIGWAYAVFVFVSVSKTLEARTAAVPMASRAAAQDLVRQANWQVQKLVGVFILAWAGGLCARLWEVPPPPTPSFSLHVSCMWQNPLNIMITVRRADCTARRRPAMKASCSRYGSVSPCRSPAP